MPNATINGTPFTGTVYAAESVPRAPIEIIPDYGRAGSEVTAYNGTEIVIISSGSIRRGWQLAWKKVPVATHNAVLAIAALTSTFTLTFWDGTYTVQCPLKPLDAKQVDELPDGRLYFDLTLTVRRVL